MRWAAGPVAVSRLGRDGGAEEAAGRGYPAGGGVRSKPALPRQGGGVPSRPRRRGTRQGGMQSVARTFNVFKEIQLNLAAIDLRDASVGFRRTGTHMVGEEDR